MGFLNDNLQNQTILNMLGRNGSNGNSTSKKGNGSYKDTRTPDEINKAMLQQQAWQMATQLIQNQVLQNDPRSLQFLGQRATTFLDPRNIPKNIQGNPVSDITQSIASKQPTASSVLKNWRQRWNQ